jgi:hypothetical protein
MMRNYVAIAIGILALGFVWSRLGVAHSPSATRAALPGDIPVVVELFSSEGCSSCPPADAYLAELDRAQPVDGVSVIALEEHVDYWDELGWRDPFAQPVFGPRQRQYASTLSDHRVFTPEIVIDGRAISDGDPDKAARDMQAARRGPRAHVLLERKGDRVSVVVSDMPTGTGDATAEVWFAVTERGLSTRVERGENAGRVLAHGPVVRVLRKLGPVTAGAFRSDTPLGLDATWNPTALRAVAFVQRVGSREIVGASELGLRP